MDKAVPSVLTFTGGCLCGRIRYESTAAPVRGVICHCSMCRKHSGAPALAFVHFPVGAFRWLGDEPTRYRSSAAAERGFCPVCGSTISMHEEVIADRMQIAAGSLDDPDRVKIDDHVWTREQLSWFHIDDRLPRFAASSSAVATKASQPDESDEVRRIKPVTRVSLRSISNAEYATFLELAVAGYAEDNVDAGRWHAEDALTLARNEAEGLLPNGIQTPGHRVLGIVAEDPRHLVGFIWFATLAHGAKTVAYIYQLLVKPEYRRRGLGRAALLAAEELARASGHAAMSLRVFSHNLAATALYRSIGYDVDSLNMNKELGIGHA